MLRRFPCGSSREVPVVELVRRGAMASVVVRAAARLVDSESFSLC